MMTPFHLHWILTVAIEAVKLSPDMTLSLYQQAARQLYARWPLAGCVVTTLDGKTHILAVGRQ